MPAPHFGYDAAEVGPGRPDAATRRDRQTMRTPMRTFSIITGLLAGAALTTPAQAQMTTQQACVGTNGLARIVPAGTICHSPERLVSWITAGPQGPQGAAGATGAAGPAGAQGPAGAVGARGPVGSPGAAGPAGPAGPAGATGAAGPMGSAGPAGATGARGPTGATGPAGSAGVAGPVGGAGPTGPVGPVGAVGPIGVGPMGIAGVAGPAGATGPTGTQGPAGTQALFGTNTNWASPGTTECVMGSVWLSAGSVAGGLLANGQTLSISENFALFALLGTTYGGDGQTTFNLLDLRSKAPNGLSYWICNEGLFPIRQ